MPELKELSLNVLDIAQNSIKANASLIEISVSISTDEDALVIALKDNGSGFDVKKYAEKLEKGELPQKNNGFGLLLFKESAEKTGGAFEISSEAGAGTSIRASYILSCKNRAPLGNINETVKALTFCCKDIRIVYTYSVDGQGFTLDTAQIKEIMGEIPLDSPDVMGFVGEYLKQNTDNINKNRIF
ncbi:MAG: ATP-binding protein [Firmicutes bacterium]|nr:ATP-binding protein [[Eubacterium] siraeum]MCM1487125.1 ATP-binding protein [Bacillota bacterium]